VSAAHSSRPLRIAYLESTSRMGGAEHVLLALLQRIPRAEFEPYLFCPEEGELTSRAREMQIPTIIQPLPAFASLSRIRNNKKILNPLAVIYDLVLVTIATVLIARQLKAAQIELIHTNTLFEHLYGGIAARLLGIPCVWHLHDAVDSQRFGGLAGWVWRQLGRGLATRIVGCSQCAVQAFSGSAKELTIYMGVDPDLLASSNRANWRARLNLAADTRLVGYVRRIDWSKGLDLLAEAAHQVIVQDSHAHFVIIGEVMFGDRSYAEQIRARVRDLGLDGHWHAVGYVADAAKDLSEFDCVVLPSRREPFGLIALEAGLASRAVVAFAVGGVPEIIESGVNGILVPPEDSSALADAIVDLLSDPARSCALGEALHERVLADFDLDRSVNRFLELYRRLLHVPALAIRA
jgi:glycosyltransferase involved in cell wall biosynthesis